MNRPLTHPLKCLDINACIAQSDRSVLLLYSVGGQEQREKQEQEHGEGRGGGVGGRTKHVAQLAGDRDGGGHGAVAIDPARSLASQV